MPAVIRPLPRPVPLRQSVYDALIDLIVAGELPPGQHMVETELARQLGVSRQPIREALHRMEAEGWVDLRPSQGAFVHVPTDREVDDLLDVREAETARLAARAASAEQVARLREIWAGGQAAAEADDFGRAVAANDSFHAGIAAIAGNSVLAELADIVGRRVRWYYRMVAPARSHGSWVEHQEMIDASEAADPDRAQLLARKHTERTRDAYHSSALCKGSRYSGPRSGPVDLICTMFPRRSRYPGSRAGPRRSPAPAARTGLKARTRNPVLDNAPVPLARAQTARAR
jgi:DNA-binding GntR family transcriptional regulator